MKKLFLALLIAAAASMSCAKDKPLMMWFDATANFKRLSSADSIRYYLDKVKAAGFTDVVVDIKPVTGEVLFASRYAPIMREWDGYRRAKTFGYVDTFIVEAHKRALRIHASLNVFAGGNAVLQRGVAYTYRPHWSSIAYTDSGMVPVAWFKNQLAAMLNPADTSVQHHELNILKEAVTLYPFDGIILDRVRYDDLHADFTPLSRWLFEARIGKKLERYPEDIFEWVKGKDSTKHSKPGKYFIQWLEWRAEVIRDFVDQARTVVKTARPGISFADYTGAGYPVHYQVGANYASTTYDPSTTYRWASASYKNTGYAELVDFLGVKMYHFEVTKEEAAKQTGAGKGSWYSVEGACEIAKTVTKNVRPVYGGVFAALYKNHPEQFTKALAMTLKKTDGLVVFDIMHVIAMDYWGPLERGVALGKK